MSPRTTPKSKSGLKPCATSESFGAATPNERVKRANESASVFPGRVSAKGLADTGALLALLDQDDNWHARCRGAFERIRLPLATSAAVLTELFHLLGDHPRDISAVWRLLESGAVIVRPIDDLDLPRIRELMAKYSDRPMDFADATLVRLAEREGLHTIFTIDHDDFETYRIEGRERFEVVPDRAA